MLIEIENVLPPRTDRNDTKLYPHLAGEQKHAPPNISRIAYFFVFVEHCCHKLQSDDSIHPPVVKHQALWSLFSIRLTSSSLPTPSHSECFTSHTRLALQNIIPLIYSMYSLLMSALNTHFLSFVDTVSLIVFIITAWISGASVLTMQQRLWRLFVWNHQQGVRGR